MTKVKLKFEAEIDIEFRGDYPIETIKEYLEGKFAKANSILTKSFLYKKDADLYILEFDVTKDE